MQDYLSFAVSLARRAGPIIKKNFSLAMHKEWKADMTPVTATDLEINSLVQNEIALEYPDHGFIGEEGGEQQGQEFVWVCDPVDGTIPFSHGIPACVFMLALLQNGRPIVSVILEPFLDRMFTAAAGKGAYLNGEKITVSKQATIKGAMFAVFWWFGYEYDIYALHKVLASQGAMECKVGSIGYIDMLVACGEHAITVFSGATPWDSAAPDILVKEAGGKFTDLFGEEIDYRKSVRGHIATNGILHDEVLSLVRDTLQKA